MNVLIVENEIYLAQSIAGKLADSGHISHITSLADDAMAKSDFDIVLLSMNTAGSYYIDIIEKYKDSIVILMIPYISEDTVTRPLRAGAKDYIVKPFIMDELLRKIDHYIFFKNLEDDIHFYQSYFLFIQNELQLSLVSYYDLPFLIKTSTQRSADIYAMKYAIERGVRLEFINLKSIDLQEYKFDKNKNYYVTNCENLKKNERKKFLEEALNYNMIISMITNDDISFVNVADITNMTNSLEIGSDVLSIQDYEKVVITKFEERYSDIELAKKLGMSRKSLWEKRKKYGITRKK